MARIVWLSDSCFLTTGFSTQSLYLLNELDKRGHECHYQATSYVGQTLPKGCVKLADGTPFNFTLYGQGKEAYGKDVIIPRIRELNADAYIILQDLFMHFPHYLEQDYAPAHTFFWFPSDGGGGLPQNCETLLRKCEVPVAMSKFAQQQAWEVHGIRTRYIPHGIFPEQFHPLPDKEAVKAKFGLQGRFVCGLISRNQPRKMLDRTLKSFKLFCQDKPDAVLLCHTDPSDVAAPFDLMFLVRRLGLQNRVFFTGLKFFDTFHYSKMNEIYNAMDVFFILTSGEGFGLGNIEAMSAGVPVVTSDYTTTKELITDNNCGEAVKLSAELTGSWTVERGIADVEDGAKKLDKLYRDAALRKSYGENGRAAVLRDYDWKVVAESWHTLITEVCGK